MPRHAIGLDFGTLSARALIVDIDTGDTRTFEHLLAHGILESAGDAVARQEPSDYLDAAEHLLSQVAKSADKVIGIGIDATASTPIPVDAALKSIANLFPGNLNAKAWLWKDHSSQAEAEEITRDVGVAEPERLARVGKYYAEWFWAKILRCSRLAPDVAAATHTWLEQCDFVTSSLTGNLRRGKCAAGHKALYYNGYPKGNTLPTELLRFADGMDQAFDCSQVAGRLTNEWAERTGLAEGTPVAVGGVDAHLGAVGAGVAPGRLCMVLGTSACHIAVAPHGAEIRSVPGISGIADDSVIPGMLGLEAGQAAFGDLFDWAATHLGADIAQLTREAQGCQAGSEGTIVLDFHSGNRCPLADARLAGVTLGQTLKTTRGQTFRAVVEATAFGIRQIVDILSAHNVPVIDLLACGGVAEKNDFVLQTIADVTGKPVHKSDREETVALGAAIFGTIGGGAFNTVAEAQSRLCRLSPTVFTPNDSNKHVYDSLFPIWLRAQSEFGAKSDVLKQLLDFKEKEQQ